MLSSFANVIIRPTHKQCFCNQTLWESAVWKTVFEWVLGTEAFYSFSYSKLCPKLGKAACEFTAVVSYLAKPCLKQLKNKEGCAIAVPSQLGRAGYEHVKEGDSAADEGQVSAYPLITRKSGGKPQTSER